MAAKISKSVQKKVSSSGAKKVAKRTAAGPTKGKKPSAKPVTKKTKSKTTSVKSAAKVREGTAPKGQSVLKGKVGPKVERAETAAGKAKKAKLTGATKSASQKAGDAPAATRKAKTKAISPLATTGGGTVNQSEVNSSVDASPEANLNSGLGVGDQVPEFEALDQSGQRVSSQKWAGAPYVLYFYPKDDTPGCTTQACGFRDELPLFQDLGVSVVGCSPDSPNAHTRFATKYGLQFTLLADIEKQLAQLFGVWKLKTNYGREYMGVERSTFLIDKDGKVARQWRGVRVAGHVSEVLQAVRELQ